MVARWLIFARKYQPIINTTPISAVTSSTECFGSILRMQNFQNRRKWHGSFLRKFAGNGKFTKFLRCESFNKEKKMERKFPVQIFKKLVYDKITWGLSVQLKIPELLKRSQTIGKVWKFPENLKTAEFPNVNHSTKHCERKIERNGTFQQDICEHVPCEVVLFSGKSRTCCSQTFHY